MSDFLSKFTREQYAETLSDNKTETPKVKKSKDKSKAKKETLRETSSVQREEYLENFSVDPNYRKKQQRKVILIGLSVVLLMGLIMGTNYVLNQVRIPDFVNQPVTEIRTWANRNNITLQVEELYSLETGRNIVLTIDPLPNQTVQKGSIIRVQVSLGADPDELIPVPDFKGSTIFVIQEWLTQNQIQNLRIIYENNDDIEMDQFIKLSFNDTSINNNTYRRKDFGVITISRGPIVYEKNIAVPDWLSTPKSLTDVMTWANTNSIQINVQRESSARVAMDGVIRQVPSAGVLIAKNDQVTVVISLGQSVRVPDFRQIAMDDAQITLSNARVRVIKMYNDTNAYGDYIWQDVAAGTNIDQARVDPVTITVYYSLGKPFIEDLVGSLESVLPKYFYDFNQQGAALSYRVTYVDSCSNTAVTRKGAICSMSVYNQFVSVNTEVAITVLKENVSTP